MSFEQACVPIESGNQRGTGYFVSDRLLVTCNHVVKDGNMSVLLGGKRLPATKKALTEPVGADVAVVELSEPVTGIEPLQFAASANQGADWIGQGFPVAAGKALRLPVHGSILTVDGTDLNDEKSLILSSYEAAAGEGALMGGFSGSPVLEGGLVVGHVKRILEDRERPGHPLFGFLFAVPSSEILRVLGWEAQAKETPPPPVNQSQRSTEILINELNANSHSPNRVFELWDILRSSGANDETVSTRAAELLIAQARPELALEVLKTAGTGTRAQLLQARADYKLGKKDKALGILKVLAQDNSADDKMYAETHGVLAGRYRERYLEENDEIWLRNAYAEYRKAWDRTRDTYCGINASTIALQLKESETALTIAQQVAEQLNKKEIDSLDHWERGTVAEAEIVLGNLESAKKWYRLAVDKAPTLFSDLARIREGAQRILTATGKEPNLLDNSFPAMRATAFFGHDVDSPGRIPPRLPRELVAPLREMLVAKISQLRIRFGFSCACRGSDLLFVKALLDSGGYPTVVLPCDRNEFARMFVGEQWRGRFEDVMSHERTQQQVIAAETGRDIWIQCRDAIRKQLRDRAAALSEKNRLLVVWDGSEGYVGDAVSSWIEDGDPVETVWPAQAQPPKGAAATP